MTRLAALVVAVALAGCSSGDAPPPPPQTPLPQAQRDSILGAVQAYYRLTPIGGGWEAGNFRMDGPRVRLQVVIPHAKAIMEQGPGQQLRLVGVACPGKQEAVWGMPGLQDIVLEGTTLNREVFIDVSCKVHGN